MLLIWAVGAVCALAGAFCYSELGVNFPSSGGEYVYLTQAFGPTWGFMTGWVSFFAGFSAPIAASALAFSDYFGHFLPALKLENSRHLAGSGAWEFKFGPAANSGVRFGGRVHHPELSGRAAGRARAERPDFHQGAGDPGIHRRRIRVWRRKLGKFCSPGRACVHHAHLLAILRKPAVHLFRLQRMERRYLCGRRAEAAGAHFAAFARLRDAVGCGAIHRLERSVHLRRAAWNR